MSVNRKGTRAIVLLISAATSALVIGCSSSTDGHPTSTLKPATAKAATTTTAKADDNPFGFEIPSGDNEPSNESDETGTENSDSGPTMKAAPGSYTGDWTGGGRKLTLNEDKTGTMTMDDADYTVEWANEGAGITVTLKAITSDADNAPEKVGKTWHAALQKDPDSDKTVLHFADSVKDLDSMFSGLYWCNKDSDNSFLCGE